MTTTLKTLEEAIERMPVYGEMRKLDKRLTFGQYLTVLHEWVNSLQNTKQDFRRELEKTQKEILG